MLPLLLLLLFGIIDFGRMLNAQITLTEAAREGARATALGFDAQPRISSVAGRTSLTTTAVTVCAGDGDPSADAVVVLTHDFRPVTPLGPILSLFGSREDGAVTITARGVMPCAG